MSRWLVAVCALVVVIAAGCGASGGDRRDQALLASVMRGVKTDGLSVRIERVAPDRPWLRLVVKSAATTTPAKVIDDWHGLLIATAYNARCKTAADHCLASYESPEEVNRLSARYARRPFAARRTLARKISAAFASAGLRVTSVSFERPYALAPLVTVQTPNPRRAVYAIRRADAAMPWRRAAGVLVQMLDRSGRVFYIEAGSWNGGEGWERPGLPTPYASPGVTGASGPGA